MDHGREYKFKVDNLKWIRMFKSCKGYLCDKSLEDFAAEVPPISGTLLAFRRNNKSYHGHKTYIGERRVVQMNWVRDDTVVRRERRRHRLSAWLKSIFPI